MKLKINKRFVKAGTVVEVSWDAGTSTSPRIVMHTGKRETVLAVPSHGTKKFKMKGVKGQHWIGLRAWQGNREKTISHRLFIYGRQKEGDDFEYMDKQDSWTERWKKSIQRWWSFFTPEKKRLYVLLLLLLLYQILFSFALFTVCHILLTVIIFWLFWQIMRR